MSSNYKKLVQCSPEQMEEFILSLVRKPVSSYVDWSNWLRSDDPSPTYIGEPAFHNEDGEEEPVDLETLGRQLYAAPWVLTADGVTLFYRDAQADYPTQVTLPYEKLPTDTFKKF